MTEGTKVHVTCGAPRFTLLTMPVEDYPTLPTMPERRGTIDGDVFTQAVAQVTVAAGRDDTLPILTGVRLEIDGDKITLLATDRYRLAQRELHLVARARPTPPRRAGPGPHPVRHGARARLPAASVELALGRPRAATGWSASSPGSAAPPPGCSTASTPRSRRSSPPTSDTDVGRRHRDAHRGGQARRPGRRAQHPGPAAVHRRARWSSRPARATTPRPARRSRPSLQGEEIEIAFNPHFLLDGLGALGTPYAGCRSPSRASRRCCAGRPSWTARPTTAYRYVLMPVRFAC